MTLNRHGPQRICSNSRWVLMVDTVTLHCVEQGGIWRPLIGLCKVHMLFGVARIAVIVLVDEWV